MNNKKLTTQTVEQVKELAAVRRREGVSLIKLQSDHGCLTKRPRSNIGAIAYSAPAA